MLANFCYKSFAKGLFGLLVLLIYSPAFAAHGIALGSTPKYPEGFSHFSYANPDAPKGGELLLSGFGNYDNLNPYVLKGISADGLGLIVETLMTKSLDEPFSVYGLLANDIELAEDQLSVTFKLNPKATFSDGKPVLADDVKFTFDTLKGEHAHPQFKFYWADIIACEVVDERTVTFRFAKVNRELHLLAAEMPVFSRDWLGDKPLNEVTQTAPIGSGAYVVERYQLGKNIRYKRNPDYWAKDLNVSKGKYNFDFIHYKYYQDHTISLEALKSGEFDFMDIYSSKQWARDIKGVKFDSGELVKDLLPHQNNAGMQGFVFNLRKPIFQDINVRRAINLAFDFEWTNKNLFFGQYTRCNSYFSNSELAATGLPQGDELALLQTFKDRLSPEIFTQVWTPVSTQKPHALRQNLRQAKRLLSKAGWKLQAGVLVKDGRKLEFDVVLAQRAFERILAPFARNLKKLGIIVNYRTVDTALYKQRMDDFDFDMAVASFAQSLSPGNEQFDLWHSKAANHKGSRNLIGLQDPVIDALVEKLVVVKNREELITVTKALDRVLLQGEYLVPNWYIGEHRVVYRDKFERPQTAPLYYTTGESWVLNYWWMKKENTK